MLFDTHAHYDDERFEKEVPGGAEALLEQLFSSDVGKIINAGTTVESSKTCLHFAEKFKGMYAAVGIHPSDCYKYSDIDSTLEEIKELSKHPKAVAIGEIGLDYHYDFSPKDVQKVWFSAQLELAKELSLPVIIHDREAHGDVFDAIRSVSETDCPYLAPTPHRGKLNHSGLLPHTAEKIAEIKGLTYSEICDITYENAMRVFNMKDK